MNPINSSVTDGQQVGVSPANPINDPDFSSNQGSNTFDLQYQNLLTARYGEITPFFYYTGLGRDRVRLQSSQDLRTYTLASPLMSSLRMKKAYFSVPLKAIMPNTWNYLFVNPVKGNDVPDNAYCYVDLFKILYNIANGYSDAAVSASTFKAFMLFYSIVSKGSLFDYLGISTSALVKDFKISTTSIPMENAPQSLDEFFDYMVNQIASFDSTSKISLTLTYSVSDPSTGETSESVVSCTNPESSLSEWRELFNLFLQHPDASLEYGDGFGPFISIMKSVLGQFVTYYKTFNSNTASPDVTFVVNLYKVIAYHMVVSQFYTNDHVDGVYNSELWLSNMKSLVYSSFKSNLTFFLNGVQVYYDVFSNRFLGSWSFGSSFGDTALYFWFNLSVYRRSLRYGDYFCSSRPQPLAVGDVNVPVVANNVSVIDVNKNLHIQRFLNAVNRVGSNIVDYAKGIFGYRPQAVDPQPNFIATEYVNVGADEIDNTASEQGVVNTNLVAQSSHFAFDVNLTDPSIILGLVSFECVGAYPYATERDNFHKDRYDMFNPFLQHIGDQDVKRIELGQLVSDRLPFGYQVRYAEYKFKYNQQHGGFNGVLNTWSFPFESESVTLDEDFIRSVPKDFDRFYKSLTNSSLANYFHFQISFQNSLTANRAMDYQPTLLG